MRATPLPSPPPPLSPPPLLALYGCTRRRYYAKWHLYSVHLDANVKLKFYGGGMTWTACIDGLTYEMQWLRIVGHLGGRGGANAATFLQIFLDTYGPLKGIGQLPDQVVTDKGWENAGILYAQERLAAEAGWPVTGQRRPIQACYSVSGNMRVEKVWQNVNILISRDFIQVGSAMKAAGVYDGEDRFHNSAWYSAALPALELAAELYLQAWRFKVSALSLLC